VRHCDCQGNGRPAIDPVLFFKMLFIGYLFGIRSKCRLVQEIHLNVAYRWFLPLRLSDVGQYGDLSASDESHGTERKSPLFEKEGASVI